jgi:hypothetical protein
MPTLTETPTSASEEAAGQPGLDLLPLRAEAALGQDHDQGRVPDDLGQFGVVEVDVADAVLAHGDADAQVHEQAGEPAARRDPNRCHRDEQNERADEQELVEVVDSQRLFPSRRSEWITLTSWTSGLRSVGSP